MPVRKFRSLQEAERSLWFEPGDRRIWEALRRRWMLHSFFGRPRVPTARGVFKFGSIQEKQRLEPEAGEHFS